MQLHLIDAPSPSSSRDLTSLQLLRTARAAEHMVCGDILFRGFDAMMASEGLKYDVIADVGGLRRIQVKSTRLRSRPVAVKGAAYDYQVYRFKGGGGGRNTLSDYVGHVDLMAFVAVDAKMIVYARPEHVVGQEVRYSADRLTSEYCDLSWTEAIKGWLP